MIKKTKMGLIVLAAMLCAFWALAQQGAQAPGGAQPGRGGAPAAGAPGEARGPGGGGRAAAPRAKKAVLAWADMRNGQGQHNIVYHALSVLERIGYESGTYDMYIRTDSNIISFKPLKTDGTPASGGPSLSNVDAILFSGHREIPLADAGKADLITFIKDQGKGFVGLFISLTPWPSFPEMANILGAEYVGHSPFGSQPGATLVNESPDFPATKHIPVNWATSDEFYQIKNYSRDKIQVLLRLDLSKYSPVSAYTQTDGDYPVAWAKMYGKGRVFYASLGHEMSGRPTENWDDTNLQVMYFEAIKWALRLTDYEVKPHPLPAGVLPPQGPPLPPQAPRQGGRQGAPAAAPAGAPPAR